MLVLKGTWKIKNIGVTLFIPKLVLKKLSFPFWASHKALKKTVNSSRDRTRMRLKMVLLRYFDGFLMLTRARLCKYLKRTWESLYRLYEKGWAGWASTSSNA